MNKNITLVVDISQFVKNRLQTGIQRVIKEFLIRVLCNQNIKTVVITAYKNNNFIQYPTSEIILFLKDVKNYKFKEYEKFEINSGHDIQKIFFDMDSIWNSQIKRKNLYPYLKEHNYKIFNFIYDLIPILYPSFMYEQTRENFLPYIESVIRYSDKIFFDSYSCKNDFFKIMDKYETKNILSDVIYLGCDYVKNNILPEDCNFINNYSYLINSKYILFVGTIEPRKRQDLILEVFEILSNEYEDLNLIFIGKFGWNVDDFKEIILSHQLLNIRIFHFENLTDYLLEVFYKNAFIVTYISEYEGFGLPICESLYYGNITLSSKNSSLVEVGLDYVEYVNNDTKDIKNKLLKFLNSRNYYLIKKKYIKSNYIAPTWDNFYEKLSSKLIN